LLALNEPETPAGEVRGLGLGKRRVCRCIGLAEGVGFKEGGYNNNKYIIFISVFFPI
jgi:hypothetical protein